MPIPKIVHQTHPTCILPESSLIVRTNMMESNSEYKFLLYDDAEIDSFMKRCFAGEVYDCFSALNVGAAKADLWRYCILYHVGGIYLDIDSRIIGSIDELIEDTDTCLITREKNPNHFNQWIIICERKHPILLRAIEVCCDNIKCRLNVSIVELTGPGAYTRAINETLLPHIKKQYNSVYPIDDKYLNEIVTHKDFPVQCRFYKADFGEYARFKYTGFRELYHRDENGIVHWAQQSKIYV